ncbi:hypothetical protein E4T56_gene3733 [Termitomyces sp. T112]|nr:hypothetical protein E4T56_gene3733 [Termitomyces sp. T112]KAH0580321.1 hypothetical protein H2248_001829 [Termitomyces sp. 'cryptogamus']
MPTSPLEVDAFYTQLQQRIVDSGEWDRIRFVLASKLNEAGWSDDLRHRSKERAREMKPLSFQTLYDEVFPVAHTSLPLAVKREILAQIRHWVDKQFL